METLRFVANGLFQHVLCWSPEGKAASASSPTTVLLIHGFMDVGASWTPIAEGLARVGYRVLAPDLRGFGDGPRAPAGSYYHFPDYVADLAAMIHEQVAADAKVHVVGHSMGGTAVTLLAGTFPERVARLAVLEGLGPPDTPFEQAPERMRRWLEEVPRHRDLPPKPLAGLEDAIRRMRASTPGLDDAMLETRAHQMVRVDADGSMRWAFDPLHRTTSPMPFYAGSFKAFAARVTCPVLFVSGGEHGFHVPDEHERLAAFRDLRRVTLDGAGHMMHVTRPDELLAALLTFFEL